MNDEIECDNNNLPMMLERFSTNFNQSFLQFSYKNK